MPLMGSLTTRKSYDEPKKKKYAEALKHGKKCGFRKEPMDVAKVQASLNAANS